MNNEDLINGLKGKRLDLLNQIKTVEATIVMLGGFIEDETLKVAAVIDEYPINGNLQERIIFTLNSIGKATASEVEAFMYKNEPNVEKGKYKNSVTVMCSAMAGVGKILSEKQGKKNLYYLV